MSKLMLRIAAGSALGVVGLLAAAVVISLLTQKEEQDPTIKEGWGNDNPRGGNTGGRGLTLIPNYNTAVVEYSTCSPSWNNVNCPDNVSTCIGEYGVEDNPVICVFDTNFLINHYANTDLINLLKCKESNTLKIIPKTVLAELEHMEKDSGNKDSRLAFKVRRAVKLLSKLPKGALVADKGFSRKKGDDAILDSIKHVANQCKDSKIYVFTGDKMLTSKINQENMDNVEVASRIEGNNFYF